MRISNLMLVLSLILANAILVAGDSTAKVMTIDKKEYQPKVTCASEDRSPITDGYARIRVQIKGLQPSWVFTKLELTKAVDDTDKDLIRDKVIRLGGGLNLGKEEPSFIFRLKQSNRSANKIKAIEGTLYLQNCDAGKPITIPDFKKSAGEFMVNDELKKHGIKIAYINKETFDEKGAKIIMDALFPSNVKVDERMLESSLASMKASCTQPNLVSLIVEDPEKKILKLVAMDPKTKKTAKSITSFKSLVMIPVHLRHSENGETPEYSHLQIFLKSKQSLQKVPVEFKNIELP